MTKEPYVRGGSGLKYTFKSIAEAIDERYPELNGKHIFEQLEALNLRSEFDKGDTPYALPYSFTDYLETENA